MSTANLVRLFCAKAQRQPLRFPNGLPGHTRQKEIQESHEALRQAGPLNLNVTGLYVSERSGRKVSGNLRLDGEQVGTFEQRYDDEDPDCEVDLQVEWDHLPAREALITYAKRAELWAGEFDDPANEPLELLRLFIARAFREYTVKHHASSWTFFTLPFLSPDYLKLHTPYTTGLQEILYRHYGPEVVVYNEIVTGRPALILPTDVQELLEPMRQRKTIVFQPPAGGDWLQLPGPYTADRATALYEVYGSKTRILNEMLDAARRQAERTSKVKGHLPL